MKKILDEWSWNKGREFERTNLIEEFEKMIKHSLYTNDDGETYIVKSLLIKQLQKIKEKK